MKIAFVNDSAQQLGVQSISSVLKQHGHEVRLFMDPQLFDDDIISIKKVNIFFNYKKILIDELKKYKPDLIGMSVVTDFHIWACELGRCIKEELAVPIIWGGIHPTSVPESVIKHEFVDMICIGEGEYPMLDLVNSLSRGEIDYTIKNIWFKKDGQVIKNDIRLLIDDLDSLPLGDTDLYYHASPHFKRTGLYVTMASRGCPFECSYCCFSYLHKAYKGKGSRIRQRSVSNVIRELLMTKEKYQYRYVAFMDNCFGYNIQWLRDFASEYARQINTDFWCIMHPLHVSERSVYYLKMAGCNTIDLGIQSWNKQIREKVLNRFVDNDAMIHAINVVKKNKIHIMTDSIFDLPGQTEEDVVNDALQYISHLPKRVYFYMLRHYPNTQITHMAKQNERLTSQRYNEVMAGINVTSFTVGGDHMDKQLVQFQMLFYLIDLLPKRVSYFIIKKKLYKYFPTILGPALIIIVRNLFAFDINSRLQRKWAFSRYAYFMKHKIVKALQRKW